MALFLYHYYDAEAGPFRNLSALSIEEAQQVQRRLQQNKNMFASQRADDYIVIRSEVESRARDQFIAKGGRPTNKYPHYMTLGPCEWIKRWYQNGRELKIPLDDVDPETISFTYGDLFPTMRYKDGKPYRGKVYLKNEILRLNMVGRKNGTKMEIMDQNDI
ncbi:MULTISPECIES: hypothetical protein [Paenibacillus]|uniref:hypothetical protein n=1 Tax=Paenibacillus TaxID=44249 RepID=UPI0021168D51|nr:hypothetical protein [Paenibacillus lautus]